MSEMIVLVLVAIILMGWFRKDPVIQSIDFWE